jgi:branched-chain amino acid transport system permease protein
VDKFLTFSIAGLSTAAIYAIAASGLVVTYTTSGIFNFAHGAFGMMAAFAYWQVHVAWGVPVLPAIAIVVFVLAPLFGALVERVIMRGIEDASEVVKIVVTVSLMVALLGVAQVIWPGDVARPVPPFFEGRFVELAGVRVPWSRLMTLVIAVAVAVGLRLVFTRTRLGIAMRSVVDDRSLLRLNGGRPGRTAMLAWAMGAGLAAISGVLISTEQTLSAVTLTLLVINAYAVAVVGRLRSLPGVFLGAVILGLAESYAVGYLPQNASLGPISLVNLRSAIPAIMLFVVILLQPEARLRAHGATRPRTAVRAPSQGTAIWGGVALVLAAAGIGALLAPPDLNLVMRGFGFALITLSLVPLTGYAGQISLAQLTFTGIGAVAMATLGATGSPIGVAVAVLICAAVGAVVALPALRLSGIYLALSTAAFALFCTSMFFNQQDVMPGGSIQVPPLSIRIPVLLIEFEVNNDYRQLMVFAVAFAVIGNVLVLLRRSAWGRRLAAMKDSPVACATLGLNLTATKVGVFALSAAIAGLGGAIAGRTFITDDFALPSSLPVTMLAVVGGIGSVAGAFLGGILLGAFPIGATVFAANAIGVFGFVAIGVKDVLAFTPGLMGISLGREPDGAAPQLAAGFRAVGQSPPALGTAVGGTFLLWLVTHAGIVPKWSFVAALVVFVFAVVPLLPLLFAPSIAFGGGDRVLHPRRVALGAWMAVALVVALSIPWTDGITSNGYRFLLVIVLAVLTARVAIGVSGVPPELLARPVAPSPDLIGVDRPLTKADALDAARAMGIPEDDFRRPTDEVLAEVRAGTGAGVR